MLGYRFAPGDVVCFRGQSRLAHMLQDSYEVTALLPLRDGVAQYRVRSGNEKHERVVLEDDVELVSDLAANSNVPAAVRDE